MAAEKRAFLTGFGFIIGNTGLLAIYILLYSDGSNYEKERSITMEIYLLSSEKKLVIMISEDEKLIISKAESRSLEDDVNTYIVQTWENGNPIGRSKFYRHGKEATPNFRE